MALIGRKEMQTVQPTMTLAVTVTYGRMMRQFYVTIVTLVNRGLQKHYKENGVNSAYSLSYSPSFSSLHICRSSLSHCTSAMKKNDRRICRSPIFFHFLAGLSFVFLLVCLNFFIIFQEKDSALSFLLSLSFILVFCYFVCKSWHCSIN